MSLRPPGVTSVRGRGAVVTVLLAAQASWSLVVIAATRSEIDLLDRLRDGALITQMEADASDSRVQVATTVGNALLVLAAVAWLVWQHRGHRNLARLGVRQLRFAPGWAVGWRFVPIANLWKPFQAIRELRVCWIGAAILAIAIVRSITWRQEEKVAMGPVPPERPDVRSGLHR